MAVALLPLRRYGVIPAVFISPCIALPMQSSTVRHEN